MLDMCQFFSWVESLNRDPEQENISNAPSKITLALEEAMPIIVQEDKLSNFQISTPSLSSKQGRTFLDMLRNAMVAKTTKSLEGSEICITRNCSKSGFLP